jgi:hypothetical protein
MASMVLLKHGKIDGIAVYVPKETILKVMAAKIKLGQHFFFDLVQELSDRTSYNISMKGKMCQKLSGTVFMVHTLRMVINYGKQV